MAVKRLPADKWFSDAVRESYDYTCAACGANHRRDPARMHCAHVHTRKHRSTRWNATYGAIALCASCHRRFTDFPIEHADFCRRHLGDANYEEAKRLAWSIRKVTKAEQSEIAAHYRLELDRVTALRAMGQTGYIPLVSYE